MSQVRREQNAAVAFRDVTKVYRTGGGVRHLNFEISQGEVFGFLGPNGAGKTTTIRLLLDLIRPSQGSISVFGLDARRSSVAIRKRVGYLPGDLALYDGLTAREILGHFAYLRGRISWAQVESLTSKFALDVDQPVRTLSKGNRQKVGLISALMGSPDLLVLDEPTSGLDPLVQQLVHEEVRRASDEGRTVLLSSHVLSEVGSMASRVGLIRAGELVAVERVDDLRQRATHVVDVTFRESVDSSLLTSLANITKSELRGRHLHLEITGDVNELVRRLASCELDDLSIREPSLEEMFMSFYGATRA